MAIETKVSLKEKLWTIKYVDAPVLPKSATAKGGKFSWKYCPLPKVDDILVPLCKKYRIGYRWESSVKQYGEKVLNCISVIIYDLDSDETVSATVVVGEFDDEMIDWGKQSTYKMRRMLCDVFGLVADEDKDAGEDDDDEDDEEPPVRRRRNTPTSSRKRKDDEDEDEEEEVKPRASFRSRQVVEDDDDDDDDEDDEEEEEEVRPSRPPLRSRFGNRRPPR